MPRAVVPTQQPAYGDLNVQTEWGQGVTQLPRWDSERREAPAKPWVTLLHMALLAHTRSVSRAHTSKWRGTMIKRKLFSVVLGNVSYSSLQEGTDQVAWWFLKDHMEEGMQESSSVWTQDILWALFQDQNVGPGLFYLP